MGQPQGLLQGYVQFGALILKRWTTLRTVPPFLGVLPPLPGSGLEDLDACYAIVRAESDIRGIVDTRPAAPSDRELAEQAHFGARWASFGFPVFSPTESLSASFVLTDSSAVSSEALQLPFESFVIELPWPQTPFQIDLLDGSVAGVRWIQVHSTDLCATQAEREKLLKLTSLEIRKVDIQRRNVLIIRLISDSGLSVFESIQTPDPGPLAKWFGLGYADRDVDVGSHQGRPYDTHAPYAAIRTSRRDRIAIVGARSFIANLCLYVASLKHERRMPKASGGSCVTNKDTEKLAPTRWVLGREIKLSPELRRASRSYLERNEKRAVWKLSARYVVRGHWRNQACGPGHREHRQVWIQPYWKGPVESPGLIRTTAVA